MIYIGIDVAKDKHDCFITNSDGEVLFKAFTIANNLTGFTELYQKIESVMEDVSKVKWRIILPVGARFARPKMVCLCIWAGKPCPYS